MATETPRIVSVFGASDPVEGSEAYAVAREVGGQLAELGYVVANGGYGGTMEASGRGAKESGGETIGVTCSIWKTTANAYIDRIEQTDSFSERLGRLIELGVSGYVALPGATGTLVELAMAWEFACKGVWKDRFPRPIVCVGRFWYPLLEMMTSARPAAGQYVQLINSPAELKDVLPPARRAGLPPRGISQEPGASSR